jgi:hypothetical protein
MYDFLNYVSFPSSLKFENDAEMAVTPYVVYIPVKGPCKIRVECYIKTKGAYDAPTKDNVAMSAWVGIAGRDASKKYVEGTYNRTSPLVFGDQDWVKAAAEANMTSAVEWLSIATDPAGSGVAGKVATTWFDDLKIFKDGVLIYSRDFNNWNPYIGGALGGAVGALTGYLVTKNPLYALAGIPTALIGAAVGYARARKLQKQG